MESLLRLQSNIAASMPLCLHALNSIKCKLCRARYRVTFTNILGRCVNSTRVRKANFHPKPFQNTPSPHSISTVISLFFRPPILSSQLKNASTDYRYQDVALGQALVSIRSFLAAAPAQACTTNACTAPLLISFLSAPLPLRFPPKSTRLAIQRSASLAL
ncbi:hypothetical protein BDV96DRAFT_262720 [Lophiotrema nucula]|uniref:Uncharacterized protein n=1 Tax=Lophiotrema nucula TaxID=690887 RepID=A0A6A5YQ90_9PLEO|nr:hypothetical protein BDV96DRAFT_262720 [Lophiotrema nucula]